jgi:hypothetical protein
MSAMVDMRRRGPEPPWAGPEIEFKPGMAREMLRELAPLLADEGILVDEHGELSDVEVPDLDTLQRALDRAVERQNLALFTPTGRARELAATALRQVTEAIADGDTARAAASSTRSSPSHPTTASRRSPVAPVWRWACWTSGCPDATRTRPPTSPRTSGCRPGTGSGNGPPQTSSPSPPRAEPSAASTP